MLVYDVLGRPWHLCGAQRTALRSWISSTFMWVLRIELKSSALREGDLLAERLMPIFFFLLNVSNCLKATSFYCARRC